MYFKHNNKLIMTYLMKKRCKDSRFIKKIILKNYVLTFRSKYGAADIEKKKGKNVYGALYNISKSDERRLDIYEEYPTLYTKMYFKNNNKLIMTYLMGKKTKRTTPTFQYFGTIKQGYTDCRINKKSLNAALLLAKHLRRR